MSVNYQVSVAFDCMMVCFTCNPGQKVWDTFTFEDYWQGW